MALQDSSLLVSLTITQWTARKLDKQVSYEICNTKEADQDSGAFHKQIVPKKYLANINQLVNKIRNYHYANTLAWNHKGADLLPCGNYLEYMATMADLRDKFDTAVDEFLDRYDEIVQSEVEGKLKGLFDPGDYPGKDQLRKKFYFQIDMTPVPSSGDFRIDINQEELDKIKGQLDAKIEEANVQAEQDLFSRFYSIVAKAVLTLEQPNKIFRNTLILNLSDICQKIPRMNINNNDELNMCAEDLLDYADSIDIADLRDEDYLVYREEVTGILRNYLQRIENIFTGATLNVQRQTDSSTEDDESEEPPAD